jgi:DNA-binding NarL/FixJ family response regulator
MTQSDVRPGPPRLLIADDDPVMCSVLGTQLRTEFHLIGEARDADGAIALAVEHQPDVALLDVEMPGGGGLRAAQGIREGSPRTAMVVLSGDETDDMVLRLLEAGVITYVRKGTSKAELTELLHASIRAHGATGAATPP